MKTYDFKLGSDTVEVTEVVEATASLLTAFG
jgi:hypothetical protein